MPPCGHNIPRFVISDLNNILDHAYEWDVLWGMACSNPDCRVCQRYTREFLNKKTLAHLGAIYSKFYTLFWPKTLYLHCILQGFYHCFFFGWISSKSAILCSLGSNQLSCNVEINAPT